MPLKRKERSNSTHAEPLRDPVSVNLDDLVALRLRPDTGHEDHQRGLSGFPGPVRTRRRGQGLEFDDLRTYVEGDDLRHADWKVTARTGTLHIRRYREERERITTVVLDLRPCMFTGSQELLSVSASRFAARLLWRAAARGERVGIMTYDGIETRISRPLAGERGALAGCGVIMGAFEAAKARRNAEPTTILTPLLSRIASSLRQAGYFVFVSSFDGLEAADGDHLGQAGSRNRLAAVRVADPLEGLALPPGRYPLRMGRVATMATMGLRDGARYRRAIELHRDQLAGQLRASGIPFLQAEAGRFADFEHDAGLIGL